jgi:hypothetical protein
MCGVVEERFKSFSGSKHSQLWHVIELVLNNYRFLLLQS